MADFEVKVYEVTNLQHHENADTLDIVNVGDYKIIIKKDSLKLGDHFAYIPEYAIVPDLLLDEMGLRGKLAGSQKNRVKAVKLRNVLSQGLAYKVNDDVGTDVAEKLGITKYEPIIPESQNGEVDNNLGKTLKYDIENIKKYPNLITSEDNVIITEKLHGTWTCLGMYENEPIVTSKGISANGLSLKLTNTGNRYVNLWNEIYESKIQPVMKRHTTWYILGEIFGRGVQDLHYNLPKTDFRVFDIFIGEPTTGQYLPWGALKVYCNQMKIKHVPELYNGKYSRQIVDLLTNENESSIATNCQREGVVVTVNPNVYREPIGRVKLKSINDNYLLRKNGTEFQ